MVVTLKTSFVKELKKLSSKTHLSVLKVLQALRDCEALETSGVDFTKIEGQKKQKPITELGLVNGGFVLSTFILI